MGDTDLEHTDLDQDPSAVLALLEADQLVSSKAVRLGQRTLSPALRATLWALRVYVVLMLAAVAVQVVRAVHAP
ncbi:MAG TPA: hypothetical protein VNM16_13305 [Bacillota bacterium]|nr:hypothetical protein [Bacillota bacterium]